MYTCKVRGEENMDGLWNYPSCVVKFQKGFFLEIVFENKQVSVTFWGMNKSFVGDDVFAEGQYL